MKLYRKILFGLVAGLACIGTAMAQGYGSDEFGAITTRILANYETVPSALTVTNSTVDLNALTGIGQIIITFNPDNAAGVGTFTVQSSADNTNWATMGSVALGVPTSISKTNLLAAGGSITNTYTNLLAATGITTPTASSAGFATPYTPALLFTNTASFALTNYGSQNIGFIINDASRYVRLKCVGSGTGTNYGWAGIIIGTPR